MPHDEGKHTYVWRAESSPLQLHGYITGGKGAGLVKTITRSTSDRTIVTIFLLPNTFVSNEKQNQHQMEHSKSISLVLSPYMPILFLGHLEIRSYRFYKGQPQTVPSTSGCLPPSLPVQRAGNAQWAQSSPPQLAPFSSCPLRTVFPFQLFC